MSQPTIYFSDINDPDETGTEEPNFCDVVLAADYDALAAELARWQHGSAIRDQALTDAHTLIQEQAVRMAELEGLLREVKRALEAANGDAIVDTIWLTECPAETLFDFIDAALAGQQQEADGR